MINYIPFYTENNSHNLPFYLLKDKNKNDVIYINNNNIVYTNSKGIDISKQILYYNLCLNKGLCYVYRVTDDVNIIKKVINSDVYYFLCNNQEEYYIYYHDNRWDNEINIHANGNYLCLTSNEYQYYVTCTPIIVKNESRYDSDESYTVQIPLNSKTYQFDSSLEKSAIAQALFGLGVFHNCGFHVQKDPQIAKKYYEEASKLGHIEAKQLLRKLNGSK